MDTRVRSWYAKPRFHYFAKLATCATISTIAYSGTTALAQTPSGYVTDPETGIVYEQRTKTIDRPIVETKVEKQEQTILRPQTVTETRPESRTILRPVVEYNWEPRMEGRWNPFKPPAVAYHHVPRTRWESCNEVIQRTNSRTEWVAEKRTIEIPRKMVRWQREQKTELVAVGRVASPADDAQSMIASRLRPLDPNTPIAPLATSVAQTPPTFAPPRIAASTVGQIASDPPRRSPSQSGLPASELSPTSGGYNQPLTPASSGAGIATLPSLPLWR
ncbi:hypothetical protein [Novipirellula artificiosorum]|uniref:Uncharacterized protein n=1 Tax=Novipirellula artificiosorum TaxID=2528016 RepID=A0A5C6DWM9_9BACT|nr:hypothetical protein [Novipirellula artificiosorum]TWU41048.1 hypothetical protein Poly41_18850 [Novipirellula artificiosorum]